MRRLTAAPFDLTGDIPVRAHLLRLGPARHVLVLVLHHVVADGWSLAPLSRDLGAAYRARSAGVGTPGWAALPVQYADYALWQRQLLGEDGDPDSLAARQLAFWEEAARRPDLLDLPSTGPARPCPAIGATRSPSNCPLLPTARSPGWPAPRAALPSWCCRRPSQ
ncbi:condensation domain-containing protein [Streptomyces sp. M10(2022)]